MLDNHICFVLNSIKVLAVLLTISTNNQVSQQNIQDIQVNL